MIEAATKDSWMALFKDNPEKNWDMVLKSSPEFIDAHRKVVTTIFDTDFDVRRIAPRMTHGRTTYDELSDTAKVFQTCLVEFLKNWARARQ